MPSIAVAIQHTSPKPVKSADTEEQAYPRRTDISELDNKEAIRYLCGRCIGRSSSRQGSFLSPYDKGLATGEEVAFETLLRPIFLNDWMVRLHQYTDVNTNVSTTCFLHFSGCDGAKKRFAPYMRSEPRVPTHSKVMCRDLFFLLSNIVSVNRLVWESSFSRVDCSVGCNSRHLIASCLKKAVYFDRFNLWEIPKNFLLTTPTIMATPVSLGARNQPCLEHLPKDVLTTIFR